MAIFIADLLSGFLLPQTFHHKKRRPDFSSHLTLVSGGWGGVFFLLTAASVLPALLQKLVGEFCGIISGKISEHLKKNLSCQLRSADVPP